MERFLTAARLAMVCLLAWPVNAAASNPATIEASAPPLYRYTDDDNTVWLMGSVHAYGGYNFDWLQPHVLRALSEIDQVYLESDAKPGWWHSHEARELYLLDNNLTWFDLMSRDAIDAITDQSTDIAEQLNYATVRVPSLAAFVYLRTNLRRNHDLSGVSGIDTRIAFTTIPYLLYDHPGYTPRDHVQLNLLDDDIGFFRSVREVPLERQAEVFPVIVGRLDHYAARYADAVHAWRAGDLDTLERALDDYAGIYRVFGIYDAAIPERAHGWSDQIAAIIESDVDTMIIVGAEYVHLDNTLLDRLGERGYAFARVQ